ncbi:hypothetical protein [Litoreibacter halocynthiae]|uniref:hypothetical protein n=1 Tax=Litoreibacter halocynthiae TaxID=1242689 RepID=UPI00248F699C|nr:hypothetical protein [Litoreibacter halocynthiae]
MELWKLIQDAELKMPFASGDGLGAILLAIIWLAAIARMKDIDGSLKHLAVLAWSKLVKK